VGFSQGEAEETELAEIEEAPVSYTVLKRNAHAWPEVYFPGIGWVEFEPTGNQLPLDRPLLPTERDNTNTPIAPRNDLLNNDFDEDALNRDPVLNEDENTARSTFARFIPTFYLILFLLTCTALTVLLNRRYHFAVRVPTLMRASLERTGIEPPTWIIRWERWIMLSAIERAFDSINFGLRATQQLQPVHATPIERAQKLTTTLPRLEPAIKILLDEHQTSLYTSRVADEKKARQAANQIRVQVLLALVRFFFTGKYDSIAP
jgi:hypothetical protein